MGLFSEELLLLDRNTARYMVSEMIGKVVEQHMIMANQEEELARQNRIIAENKRNLAKKYEASENLYSELASAYEEVAKQNEEMSQYIRKYALAYRDGMDMMRLLANIIADIKIYIDDKDECLKIVKDTQRELIEIRYRKNGNW